MKAASGEARKMGLPSAPPPISIVLEWETGGECARGRARACLEALSRQCAERAAGGAGAPEVILVHDPLAATRREVLAAASGLEWAGGFVIAEPPRPLGYYEKKNFGFARSRGSIVVFVDSDLAPEPGWLASILEPFSDPAKNVVVGLTHFETRTLYERAMALFWIFEAREPHPLVRRTERLVSNNIAFRRAVFAALPFPTRPTYRGQCSELGAKLGRLGIVMYEATAARAAHPAPRGPAAFAGRAFRAGRDAAAYAVLEGRPGRLGWLRELRRDLGAVRRRVAARGPAIGAGTLSRAAAYGLGLLFYAIKASGYATAAGAPSHSPGAEKTIPGSIS